MALRITSYVRNPALLKRSLAAVNPALSNRFMSDMAFTFAAPNGVHYKVNNVKHQGPLV